MKVPAAWVGAFLFPAAVHECTEPNGVSLFDRHAFGARRIALGRSVEALAAEMRVAPSTIRRWESGGTCPSLPTLVRASRHLNTPLLSLIRDEDTPERRQAEAVAVLLHEDISAVH
ncbi:helix-turn-helix domain-containing protein [Streptomyces sp. NPDC090053]|uniref:helix-turn-helix domain-containing protein n=1 Tax=Streptomyces sp. NPDC090053 TaxID=3365932 RepID=UPI003811BCE0